MAWFTRPPPTSCLYLNADVLYPNGHHGHNVHFLIHALNLDGRYRSRCCGRAAAGLQGVAARASGSSQRVTWRQGYFRLIKTLVRFERWDDILDGRTIPTYDKPEQRAWRLGDRPGARRRAADESARAQAALREQLGSRDRQPLTSRRWSSKRPSHERRRSQEGLRALQHGRRQGSGTALHRTAVLSPARWSKAGPRRGAGPRRRRDAEHVSARARTRAWQRAGVLRPRRCTHGPGKDGRRQAMLERGRGAWVQGRRRPTTAPAGHGARRRCDEAGANRHRRRRSRSSRSPSRRRRFMSRPVPAAPL